MRKQIFRFGVVGTNAAIVHLAALMALVEFVRLTPLLANVFAFLIAYQVSFWGHRRWTFSSQSVTRHAWIKFFVVAGLSFVLNESLFAIFLHLCHLYYFVAIILTLIIVPPLTFIASKLWAFS